MIIPQPGHGLGQEHAEQFGRFLTAEEEQVTSTKFGKTGDAGLSFSCHRWSFWDGHALVRTPQRATTLGLLSPPTAGAVLLFFLNLQYARMSVWLET